MSMKEEMHQRALMSAWRLLRLVEIDAPSVIVARELRMLSERLFLLDPAAHAEIWWQDCAERLKPIAGFCGEHGCEARLAPTAERTHRYQKYLCLAHAYEREKGEDDEDDGDEGEDPSTEGAS